LKLRSSIGGKKNDISNQKGKKGYFDIDLFAPNERTY
jgi:hypothetical protein